MICVEISFELVDCCVYLSEAEFFAMVALVELDEEGSVDEAVSGDWILDLVASVA